MKVGRYNLTKHTPRSVYERRIRPIFDPHVTGYSNWLKRILVNVTNQCNLACYSCSSLCDRPIGTNSFRMEPITTPLNDIDQLLDRLEGYRPEYYVRLTGGEPTYPGPDYLKEASEIIRGHNRKVSILTNGYRFLETDPWWFDQVTLDNHTINSGLVEKCRRHMTAAKYRYYEIVTTQVHRNLELQRANWVTEGPRCQTWMENPSLWREAVYPCCVLYYLDGWENTDKLHDTLIESGWSIHNPELRSLLENWRETTPVEVAGACVLWCWNGGPNIEYREVTAK